jgi:hypothetical protein
LFLGKTTKVVELAKGGNLTRDVRCFNLIV